MLVPGGFKGGGRTVPYDDELAAEDGLEEGGDGAGGLAVVFWQTEECHDRQGHEEHRDGKADGANEGVGGLRHGNAVAVV